MFNSMVLLAAAPCILGYLLKTVAVTTIMFIAKWYLGLQGVESEC